MTASLSVENAISGRRSIRCFLPDEVDLAVIHDVLVAASRAASGNNIQPWLVHIAAGSARDRLSAAVMAVALEGQEDPEYPYMIARPREPYLARRRKLGHELYSRYGIERSDIEARRAAMLRNFEFFGAPVGIFFTLERDMADGSWLDCGMFMQNVMLMARAHGLETCAQQAWCDHGSTVRRELGIPDDQMLLSGMAIGYADWSAPENGLISERAPFDEFVQIHL